MAHAVVLWVKRCSVVVQGAPALWSAVGVRRFGIGIGTSSQMTGPSTGKSNAVICSPGDNTVNQYDMTDTSYAGVTAHPTAGTTNMAVSQTNGVTSMSWTRNVSNGDDTDAQISTTGGTWVLFAVGSKNTFQNEFPAPMSAKFVNLMTTVTYAYTATLTQGLVLNWNVVGARLDFQAVLSGTAWYVISCVVTTRSHVHTHVHTHVYTHTHTPAHTRAHTRARTITFALKLTRVSIPAHASPCVRLHFPAFLPWC